MGDLIGACKQLDLNSKYDNLNDSIKGMSTKIVDSIKNLFQEEISKISIKCTQENINNAFYNYEKQNGSIEKNSKSKSSIWINRHLPGFRFTQIKFVIEQMLDEIVSGNQSLNGIMLNRDEKRSMSALCNHLDRFWDIVQPKFNDFVGEKLDKIKTVVEEKYDLNKEELVKIGICSREDYLKITNQIVRVTWSKNPEYVGFTADPNTIKSNETYTSFRTTINYETDQSIKIDIHVINSENLINEYSPKIKITTEVEE